MTSKEFLKIIYEYDGIKGGNEKYTEIQRYTRVVVTDYNGMHITDKPMRYCRYWHDDILMWGVAGAEPPQIKLHPIERDIRNALEELGFEKSK